MKVKITTENGNTIDAELTAEQAGKLGLTEKKKTGWERAEKNKRYYAIGLNFALNTDIDNSGFDDHRYYVGNYFTDEALGNKMAKRVSLMLRMQRWADEHDGAIDWNNISQDRYYFFYDYTAKGLEIALQNICTRKYGVIYFSSRQIAEQAIKIFGQDIIEAYIKE